MGTVGTCEGPVTFIQDGRAGITPGLGGAEEVVGVENVDRRLRLGGGRSAEVDPFWRVWVAQQRQLFLTCITHIGGNRQEAVEALSVVMLKARQVTLRQSRRIRNLKAWLGRLAVNFCLNARRDHQRRSRETVPLEAVLAEEDYIRLASSGCDTPDQQLLRAELDRLLHRCIEELPPSLRAATVGYFLQNRSCVQLAKVLGVSASTVRQRIHRSRQRLRQKLQTYLAGTGDRHC